MKFHENLQRLRKEAGLSQEEVAQKLFLSRQSVSKWETGGAEPGIDNLKALAKLYGVTVDELVGSRAEAEQDGAEGEPSDVQKEEQQDGKWVYLGLLTIRLILFVSELLSCVTLGYQVEDVWYAFPDLFFLNVGVWVAHPYMWMLLISMQLFSAVFGVVDLTFSGSFPALLSIFSSGLCAGLLYAPSIRKRFHVLPYRY